MRMTRRKAVGSALGGLAAMTAVLSSAHAAKAAGTRHCLTVLYPWKSDARFDFDYYIDKHLPMLRQLYGKSVGKMDVHKGLNRSDGSPPGFVGGVTVEITSMEAFDAAANEHRAKLIADVPNFSNITPIAQIDEIVDV